MFIYPCPRLVTSIKVTQIMCGRHTSDAGITHHMQTLRVTKIIWMENLCHSHLIYRGSESFVPIMSIQNVCHSNHINVEIVMQSCEQRNCVSLLQSHGFLFFDPFIWMEDVCHWNTSHLHECRKVNESLNPNYCRYITCIWKQCVCNTYRQIKKIRTYIYEFWHIWLVCIHEY